MTLSNTHALVSRLESFTALAERGNTAGRPDLWVSMCIVRNKQKIRNKLAHQFDTCDAVLPNLSAGLPCPPMLVACKKHSWQLVDATLPVRMQSKSRSDEEQQHGSLRRCSVRLLEECTLQVQWSPGEICIVEKTSCRWK